MNKELSMLRLNSYGNQGSVALVERDTQIKGGRTESPETDLQHMPR